MKTAAIIDNSINIDILSEIMGKKLKFSLSVNNGIVKQSSNIYTDVTHGTVCSAVFFEFATECETSFISVADGYRGMPIVNIVAALKWCLDNNIDIISMSIGTESWWDLQMLSPIIHNFKDSSTVIVAASANKRSITYPSALPETIGVKHCESLQPGQIRKVTYSKEGVNFVARLPTSVALEKLKSRYGFPEILSNSLVTPYIAAQILQVIPENRKKGNAIDMLNIPHIEHVPKYSISNNEINIPLIGIAKSSNDFTISLHAAFLESGYVSALLTLRLMTNYYKNMFHIQKTCAYEDIIEYIDILNADIILIDMYDVVDDRILAMIDKKVTGNRLVEQIFTDIENSFISDTLTYEA